MTDISRLPEATLKKLKDLLRRGSDPREAADWFSLPVEQVLKLQRECADLDPAGRNKIVQFPAPKRPASDLEQGLVSAIEGLRADYDARRAKANPKKLQ